MRDYSNMPVLDWNESEAAYKAKAQILHQEPVILQMPADFDTTLDGSDCDCDDVTDDAIQPDCPGGPVLEYLANKNRQKDLHMLAEACNLSSSRVDIDRAHKRLIVHD